MKHHDGEDAVDKFFYVNLKDFFTKKDVFANGEKELNEYISTYECPVNADVESFFKRKAIEFSNKKQSVTYLVFTTDDVTFVGYFTLAVKPLVVKPDNVSKTMEKKIKRISVTDAIEGSYLLPAYLIAQLGKNYYRDSDKRISGDDLVALAIDAIEDFVYGIGGLVIYLEAEPADKLLQFYQNEQNKFRIFDTRKTDSGNQELIRLLKII